MDLNLPENSADPVFRLGGTLTYRDNTEFNRLVTRLGNGTGTVTLDLAALEYMDSFGVGLMMLVRDEARKHGRRLRIVNLQKPIRELFERLDLMAELPIDQGTESPAAPTIRQEGGRLMVSDVTETGTDARVRLSGRFVVADQQQFLPVIAAIGRRRSGSLVIDLEALTFMDSAGLSMIMLANDEARRGGTAIAIAKPRGAVKDLLKLAAIDLVIPVHDDL